MSHIQYDGSGELHITNITEAAQMDKSGLDRVITVCQEPIRENVSDEMIYSWYDMSDGDPVVEGRYGGSCEYELFEEAADELYTALNSGEHVLIHCHQGTSRSVSVATAALGRMLEQPRSEALALIHYYRPRNSYPDSLLMKHARRYITEHTEVSDIPFNGEQDK